MSEDTRYVHRTYGSAWVCSDEVSVCRRQDGTMRAYDSKTEAPLPLGDPRVQALLPDFDAMDRALRRSMERT